jgi:phage FluMu protein Com
MFFMPEIRYYQFCLFCADFFPNVSVSSSCKIFLPWSKKLNTEYYVCNEGTNVIRKKSEYKEKGFIQDQGFRALNCKHIKIAQHMPPPDCHILDFKITFTALEHLQFS